ncbi:beta-catenin-like protein 1 [Kwoniella heveanensis CBS 569]|uniref:Beta-catenin-like protein 1 n=1 Tax=Kwoniella heveanensis BCC8398 TaxID=1296120 RepID=A0A1B9GV67_9TREE|nr:beta-catenin-like protein 1 [Kwoniella heveanensis BCC8398]OCF39912.1 beta-catenin-like protein 1 [Kwoniella heveanensis CBS 569]
MDIDKMFKLPALPASGNLKRKMPDAPTQEMLKKYRAAEPEPEMPPPQTNGKGKARAATVEEDDEEGYARGGEEVYEGDEDDEGRFFGGGLNNEQQQILDIFDAAGDEEDGPTLDLPGLRRQLAKFERIVRKNAEQRGKFPDDPSKFIESESDLDGALKQFLPLTQNPPLFYPELIKSGVVALLTNLLSHENTDIAIDVVEVLRELTDEDVGAEVDDLEEEEQEAEGSESKAYKTRMAMGEFIDELLNNSILDLLVSNLSRLDESEDTDSQGVFQILGAFENLLSFMPPLAEQIVTQTSLLPWLLKRVQKKEYDSNKQYASEILAILLQDNREIIMRLGELQGLDSLLQVLSQYRKKDPGDSEEVEFMENIFDCLCSALSQPEMKHAFLEAEGVELMVLMMKEKLLSKTRAIKVLNYALQTEDGAASCEKFVEVLGLKSLFSAFMGKGEGKKKKLNATSSFEDEEHVLGILASLFTNLGSDTPERIRLIAKFVESNYEKVERLLEMREAAEGKLRAVNKEIAMERRVMEANKEEITDVEESEWYLRRMDAGLSSLQNADYVLSWVCMEDDGAMTHARVLLARKDKSFKDVVDVLTEFKNNVGDEPEDEEEEPNVQRMILEQLIAFMDNL